MNLQNTVLFAVLMLFSMSSHAGMVAKDNNGNSVTLHEAPCVSSPWLKDWKTATFIYGGKTYAACWRIQNNMVIVIDSAGDVSPLPMEAFKPETKV